MINLIPRENLITNQILYIIGNGFDLAHDMRTSYEDFHQWLLDNGESSAVNRIESLYLNITNNEGRWCDVESALGSITLEEAINYDRNYQECPDEIYCEDSSHEAYRCGENLKNVVDILPGLLRDWVASISTKDISPKFEIIKDAKFLSFNYTRTLEDAYQIKTDNILHIHETIIENRPLVVGCGEALFDEANDYPLGRDDVDIQIIRNILSHSKKPVEAILKEPKPKTWFGNLNEVTSVVVFGHSCSKVDKPYFETVAESIQTDAYWQFYVHDSTNNKAIEVFAQSFMKDQQKFEIINQ